MKRVIIFLAVFLFLVVSLVSASYGQNAYGAGFYGSEPVSYTGGSSSGSGAAPAATVNETANATVGEEVLPSPGGSVGGEAAAVQEETAASEEVAPSGGEQVTVQEQVSEAISSPGALIVVVAVVIVALLWLFRSKLGL